MKRQTLSSAFLCTLFVGVILTLGTIVQSEAQSWSSTGWAVTSFAYGKTGGSPGDSGYSTSSPYVYAYQGQFETSAFADASYLRTWTYQGQTFPPVGWLYRVWRIIGTIGFYEDPEEPEYTSTANALTETGPEDYDIPDPVLNGYQGNYIAVALSLESQVLNFGHASAQGSASVTDTPPA